jgi:hypothetical protein
MPSPRPRERTSTLRCPSLPSRKENWSIGVPLTLSALGAVPSRGMRKSDEFAAHTKTEPGET